MGLGMILIPERCICAAWKTVDGNIYRGHRHSHCIAAILDAKKTPSAKPYDQGFMTSANRFVMRSEGAKLEREARTISVWTGQLFESDILFSEDLY